VVLALDKTVSLSCNFVMLRVFVHFHLKSCFGLFDSTVPPNKTAAVETKAKDN